MAKILIVDDSRTSRKILRGMLEGAGHEIVGEAINGEEGYLMFKELRPELTTMDITMPRMDGIESLQLIKKVDSSAKVVMITAAGQESKILTAIKHGAQEFITKPFDNKVVNVIEEVLRD